VVGPDRLSADTGLERPVARGGKWQAQTQLGAWPQH
jgi:hypothetical protein